MVVIHKGRCIMHCGMAAPGTVPGSASAGPIGAVAMKSGSGNYLANLILFPGTLHVYTSSVVQYFDLKQPAKLSPVHLLSIGQFCVEIQGRLMHGQGCRCLHSSLSCFVG